MQHGSIVRFVSPLSEGLVRTGKNYYNLFEDKLIIEVVDISHNIKKKEKFI